MKKISSSEFLSLLTPEEKKTLTQILSDFQSGTLTEDAFFSFAAQVLEKNGFSEVGPRITGPLWGSIRPRRQEKKAEQTQREDLNAIISKLPYPLSYHANNFVRDVHLRSNGEALPQFPFTICRTLSIIIRYISTIAIQAYIDINGKDQKLNIEIHKVFKSGTDGSWLALSYSLIKELNKDNISGQVGDLLKDFAKIFQNKLPLLDEEKTQFTKKVLNQRSIHNTAQQLLTQLVSFRNDLLHGEHMTDVDIDIAQIQLQFVLYALKTLTSYRFLIYHKNKIIDLNALTPKELAVESSGTLEEGVPYLCSEQCAPLLRLAPLMQVYSPDEELNLEDILFINKGDPRVLEYLGFTKNLHIDGKKIGSYDSFQEYLANIPAPPLAKDPRVDFTAFTNDKIKNFVGRQDCLDEINERTAQESGKYIILKSHAGMGKSSILSKLYHQRSEAPQGHAPTGDLWVFHFCMHTNNLDNSVIAFRSLIAQLCDGLGKNRKAYLDTDIEKLKDNLMLLLNGSEEALTNRQGQRIIVAIDALDEGIIDNTNSIPNSLPNFLAPHVNILLSYRVNQDNENKRVENHLSHIPTERMNPLQSANPLSGLEYDDVKLLLNTINTTQVPEKTIDAIWAASTTDTAKADPFYLRFVSDGTLKGLYNLERVETLPQSMDEAFETLWLSLPDIHDFLVHRILCTLGIMRDYGDDSLFLELFNRQFEKEYVLNNITEARLKAGKLLRYDGDKYTLFHDRFKTFLVGEQPDPILAALELEA